jgi:hypothetical protein
MATGSHGGIASGGALLRAALSALDEADLQTALSLLAPPVLGGEAPAVRSAINWLRRRGDIKGGLKQCGQGALQLVAEAVCDECLTDTIELLGDHADNPDSQQLRAALRGLPPHHSPEKVNVMLAFVVASRQPAASVSLTVLEERGVTTAAAGRGPAEPPRTAPAGAHPAEPPAPAPNRRARKSGKRQPDRKPAGKSGRGGPPPWSAKQRRTDRRSGRDDDPPPPDPPAEGFPSAWHLGSDWRAPLLTPAQKHAYDVDDELVGCVVLAEIEFTSVDPALPGVDRKDRPCVVVAASDSALLVRPASTGSYHRRRWKAVVLQHWREAGLDRQTWVTDEVRSVPRERLRATIGTLDREDWNALW